MTGQISSSDNANSWNQFLDAGQIGENSRHQPTHTLSRHARVYQI